MVLVSRTTGSRINKISFEQRKKNDWTVAIKKEMEDGGVNTAQQLFSVSCHMVAKRNCFAFF